MKKVWTLIVLLCLCLVACESATDDATRGKDPDKEIFTLEKLIAQQNGSFNDEIFMETLFKNSLVLDRLYVMNNNGAWELEWEYVEDAPIPWRNHYLFSDKTFTINRVDKETRFSEIEDMYVFDDYDYSYDADTNLLTTYCSFDSKEIKIGEKQEATIVYFDGDIVVLDGYFIGSDINISSMWRYVFKIDKETRDNIIRIEKYLDEPQDVDSKAIFERLESSKMRVYVDMAIKYNPYLDIWNGGGVCGEFIKGFTLKGDCIVFYSTIFDEIDGVVGYHEVSWDIPVVCDVENDTLYTERDVPGVGVWTETLKAFYYDGQYVLWLYDVVHNNYDSESTAKRYILISVFE